MNIIIRTHKKLIYSTNNHPIIALPDSANIAQNYYLWNIMDIFPGASHV
jgi:hypothetical protein